MYSNTVAKCCEVQAQRAWMRRPGREIRHREMQSVPRGRKAVGCCRGPGQVTQMSFIIEAPSG